MRRALLLAAALAACPAAWPPAPAWAAAPRRGAPAHSHARKAAPAKATPVKERAAKERAAKDQAAKDQAAKDQAAKDQAAKELAAKQASPAQAPPAQAVPASAGTLTLPPPATTVPAQAAAAGPVPAADIAPAPPAAVQAEALPPAAAPAVLASEAPSPVPGPAPGPAPSPVPGAALQRVLTIEPVPGADPAILLRVDREVGIAAFRSGADVLVVLDAALDIQVPGPALDPVFARAASRRTQDATVLRVPLPLPRTLRLARDPRGWVVTAAPPAEVPAAILPRLIRGGPDVARIQLPASEPSRIVTVVDPQTGDRLLVGTQGVAGQAVAEERQQAQFTLRPTLQGVVVAASSDDIQLRRDAEGFVLVAGTLAGTMGSGSILSAADPWNPAVPVGQPVSQLLDIPNDTTEALAAKLNERVRFAANTPARSRSVPRLRVAEVMVALGMGVEAQAVLDVAAVDDPALRDMPRAIGLRAVASLLAQRLDDADSLGDPRLNGTLEMELWRALLRRARDRAVPNDPRILAAALPVVGGYPAPLRARLLPGMLEAMASGGQAEAARTALQAWPDSPELDLARGMVLEATDQPAGAMQAYDQVAARTDQLSRYKAQLRAAELRLRMGQLDAKGAADALERALFGWRGPPGELPLRFRIAELRRQAGQWREALAALANARAAFPNDGVQIDREMMASLVELFAGEAGQRMPRADFLALYDMNAELVQAIPWTEAAGMKLVDRLVALGLQSRAEPLLGRLIASSTVTARRAALGTTLASLRLALDDPRGAIAALADTVPTPGVAVPPNVMEARQLIYARAEAARGNDGAALAMLDTLGTAAADEARADIFAARKDWPHAVAALTALERKRVPAPADLSPDQQALVMRLAVAATLAGDNDTLGRLNTAYAPVMSKGNSASLFRLVTSTPVRTTTDLPRAYDEIRVARGLPSNSGAPAPK